MSTKPDNQMNLETQPRRKVFSLLLLSAAAIIVMIAMVIIPPGAGSHDIDQKFVAISEAGHVLLTGYIGWVFGVFVTVLFGFFVFVLGSQVIAGPLRAAKVRARLGAVAMTIAVVATVLTALAGFGLVKAPEHWGGMVGVVAVLGLICFLGVEVGIFSIPGLPARLEMAGATIIRSRGALDRTKVRASKPWWSVAACHALSTAGVGWAVSASWMVKSLLDAVALAVFYLLIAVLVTFPVMMARSAALQRGRPFWKLSEGIAAIIWVVSEVLLLCTFPDAENAWSYVVTVVGVGLCLTAAASGAVPLVRDRSLGVNWSLAGAASALVHGRAAHDLAKAEEEKGLLAAALEEQGLEESPFRDRFLAAVSLLIGTRQQHGR